MKLENAMSTALVSLGISALVMALAAVLSLTGCASVPAECVICPPPIALPSLDGGELALDAPGLIPCDAKIEGCYGFALGTSDFFQCSQGTWSPVDSPF